MSATQRPDKANFRDFLRQLRGESEYKGICGGLF